jgi:hypothetical protein
MMIKAHILIHLLDGSTIKYVNKIVQDGLGKNGEYYAYTNETGHQLINQDGAGKALGDYNSLIAQIGETGLVTWPEGGTFLERKNIDQNIASKSKIRTTLTKKNISKVVLVEQEINEWQQLDIDRRP